jgi:hypothetical protein
MEMPSVRGADTCAFLPPVLESVKSKVREVCRIGVVIDTNNTALVMKLVRRQG